MKIVKWNSTPTLNDALETIDQLRQQVVDGKITAFFIAGLDDEDCTYAFVGSVKPVSRLRLQGSMSQAVYAMQSGEV